MKGKIKIHHAVVLVLVSIFLSFVLFSGCEKEVEKIVTEVVTITDTVEVILVTIEGINANPDSISQGGTITLTATVTKESKVGEVVLTWTAAAGVLSASEGDTVTWKAPDDAGPRILLGSNNRSAGKIFVDMTGGTEGSKEIFKSLVNSGVNTIVGMHLSDEHRKEAEKHHLNVVIAGHISSDNLGINLMLDEVQKKGKLNIIECSGFRRFSRKK